MKNKRILGIVGIGPRGLFALENYMLELKKSNSLSNIHLLLFEETGNFGNGHVYNINQADANWVNINERILELEERKEINFENVNIPAFPSYHDWAEKDFSKLSKKEIDSYPLRSKIGKYLSERFKSFAESLLKIKLITLFKEKVVDINLSGENKIILQTNLKTYDHIDEILLTIGHQPTQDSEQIVKWEKFSSNKDDVFLFKSPYPIKDFLKPKYINKNNIIGIRGFGLAMIDVVRSIATNLGDFFIIDDSIRSCKYESEDEISNILVPFSLDGLPPAPKPLNAFVDEWFQPTTQQIQKFEKIIGDKSIQQKAKDPGFLLNAFSEIAAQIYLDLPRSYADQKMSIQETENIIQKWLQNNDFEHSNIVSVKQNPEKTMKDFVAMAVGEKPISLDYCIGQVWRHCQPSMYSELSFNECSNEVFKQIIDLDESTKRYSYGPPVESIQQLLALIEAKVMTLDFVNNPDFELKNKGWLLHCGGKEITVNIMIDSVLDSPQIEAVNSSIIKNLLSNDLIKSVHDDLGISIDEDTYVISQNENKHIPIALLGRLAKGTVIGVDAIRECFGERPKIWASKAAKNHTTWLQDNG